MPWSPQANWQPQSRPNTARAAPMGLNTAQAMPATPGAGQPAQSGQLGNSQGPLGAWNNWMTSGGVNPSGWQQFSGPTNTGFLDLSHWSPGASDPGHGTATDPQSGFQPYIDTAYQQATRELDPQWSDAKTQFDQDMVNRGLAPGSAAYDAAYANFNRSKEDAYNNARSSAQQQGLAAQQQAFGQGIQQSQLSNALAQALIGANSSYLGGQLSGNQSLVNALLGGNQGIAQQLIGADATRAAAASSAAASRANSENNYRLGMAGLQQSGQQSDWNNLMQLLGMGQGAIQYNNGLLNSDIQRQQMMYGGMPQGNYGNIDVQSPYNNQYNGQMNQWNFQNQQANAQNQNYAQWASLLASMYGGG